MNIGSEIKTERGVATYLGEVGIFSVFIHLSPAPVEEQINGINSIDPDIDILISNPGEITHFLGFIPFSDVVLCGVGDGFDGEKIALSATDCCEIDSLGWDLLTSKYRLAPVEFLIAESD